MVSEPTVFVVGAGGSMQYGYPSGGKLVDRIIESLEDPEHSSLGITLIGQGGCSPDHLRKFRKELLLSRRNSIDAFLEKRPDFLEVGRQAIAASLITFEDAQQRHRESGDWYRFLSNKLIDNVEDGKSAPFTILTFNYDRSLDFYLYTAFRHALRIDGAELGVKLSNLKIIHLHGSLCRLPWQVGEGPARDYGDTNGDALITSANNIKIIHEQNEGTEVFKQAHAALNRAARIVFLGFGFHATNVRRLLAGGWLDLKQRGMIYASSHGMIHAERQAVERTFSEKIILPEAHSDCLGILRNVPGFLS